MSPEAKRIMTNNMDKVLTEMFVKFVEALNREFHQAPYEIGSQKSEEYILGCREGIARAENVFRLHYRKACRTKLDLTK
jgi:hypothetical protein